MSDKQIFECKTCLRESKVVKAFQTQVGLNDHLRDAHKIMPKNEEQKLSSLVSTKESYHSKGDNYPRFDFWSEFLNKDVEIHLRGRKAALQCRIVRFSNYDLLLEDAKGNAILCPKHSIDFLVKRDDSDFSPKEA